MLPGEAVPCLPPDKLKGKGDLCLQFLVLSLLSFLACRREDRDGKWLAIHSPRGCSCCSFASMLRSTPPPSFPCQPVISRFHLHIPLGRSWISFAIPFWGPYPPPCPSWGPAQPAGGHPGAGMFNSTDQPGSEREKPFPFVLLQGADGCASQRSPCRHNLSLFGGSE